MVSIQSVSRERWGQSDVVDPQDGLRLDDDLFPLIPVSLPERHQDFGSGLSLLDDSGLHVDQLLSQQWAPNQSEVLGPHQQHLLHSDPVSALRLNVVLHQNQVLIRHLPLSSSEVYHGEQPAKVLPGDDTVHGGHHSCVQPLLLLQRHGARSSGPWRIRERGLRYNDL